jgi:methylase of polypeptide subunit release factors
VDSELIGRLRSDLTAAGFSVAALTGLWGVDADAALHRNQRVPALRALAALRESLGRAVPSATLARLFVLGLPVAREELAEALPTLGVDGAGQLGLVAADATAGQVRPLLDLRPYSFIDAHGAGSWWIASDLGELALGHPLGESHVLGVGGASVTLSGLLMPIEVERALDLGTGCGIQAMHAARNGRRVVATDISERALELAALNAELNGIRSIEFRLGSLFEPVAGERFDHIISNPPFVITPRAEGVPAYEYRDGGMVGDGLVEAVIRGIPEHLTADGVAQLLGNWEYRGDGDAFDRMRSWLDDSLDAWIIEREVQQPSEYAETWIRDGGTRPGTPDFDRLYASWLDDFAARGVNRVGFGYMLLRRRPAHATTPPLRRFERLHGSLGQNNAGLGSHLADSLGAWDWQAATDDASLLAAHLTVAPDVTEERHYWPGASDPTLMTLHQGGGFGRSVQLDTALAALVGASDGELPVGAIIAALAQLLDASVADLTAALLPAVRDLVTDGFLRPPGLS